MSNGDLIFLIPLITSVGWFIVTNLFMGGLMDGDADVEADADIDVEVEVEADADLDASVVDANAEAAGDSNFTWLGFLGFRKVPFILWLQILGTIWGTIGLVLLVWFDSLLVRAIAAGATTIFGTGAICALLSRVMPKTESDLMSDRELLGTTGRVTTSKVTSTFGQAVFAGKLGYMTREVRVAEGAGPLAQDEVVIVVGDRDGALVVEREADLLRLERI